MPNHLATGQACSAATITRATKTPANGGLRVQCAHRVAQHVFEIGWRCETFLEDLEVASASSKHREQSRPFLGSPSKRMLLICLPAMLALLPADYSALDVNRILTALSGHARTRPGSILISRLPLASSAEACRTSFDAVGEALALDESQWPPLPHPLDIISTLENLSIDRRVPLLDLADTAEALSALLQTSKWATEPHATGETLIECAARAAPPERLTLRLCSAFERDERGVARLSSGAFPALKQRREALLVAERALSAAVKKLGSSLSGIVSEADAAVPRLRDGRLVVPVLAANKKAAGVEVATSRSGRTVFVEPHALVNPSAGVRAAQVALEVCEARLIGALCGLLELHSGALCEAIDAAAELDAILARASLGSAWSGHVPIVGDEGVLCVRGARHPLLALQALEPGASSRDVRGNRLSLRASCEHTHSGDGGGEAEGEGGTVGRPQGLMLTGPNGGGKSVVLKTAALYAVLVRLGVPLPCDAKGARVDYFAHVTTDLADTQSLSDGASSFAAHLRACQRALTAASDARAAGEHALVLLDEPGSSTDPLQGAAIARSVIEALLDDGALLVAATHSDALKAYGLADVRLMVAAMARAADGTPLYTLIPGAVGSSHALDAARREGLPSAILERAAQLLPGEITGGDTGGGEEDGEDADAATARRLRVQTEGLLTALQARMADADIALDTAEAERDTAATARANAAEANQKAATSLADAEKYLAERIRSVDGLVSRLRKQGAADLELLGETLKALRLAEKDASTSRERVLTELGLQPVGIAERLKPGTYLSYVVDGAKGEPPSTIDARVVDDAYPGDSGIKVELAGAPAEYVPRADLASWGGGAADDFGGDWGDMGGFDSMMLSQADLVGAPGQR